MAIPEPHYYRYALKLEIRTLRYRNQYKALYALLSNAVHLYVSLLRLRKAPEDPPGSCKIAAKRNPEVAGFAVRGALNNWSITKCWLMIVSDTVSCFEQ